ncbi:zonadhesin-like [Diachasmimorpha longicaudata]|uniref:zonadhesin-like n=1 Tax=Diachasmimorpha longicaudata TaxID=58733 RepID=UPI0030B8CE8B
MSSAILLIIVASCGFAHAGPYHGRRIPEIPQYDYDLEESDNYEYPSAPVTRMSSTDVDISVNSLEKSIAENDGKNDKSRPGTKSLQTRKLSRRSNEKTPERYRETVNVHDNRDVWGSFDPPKSKGPVRDEATSGATSDTDYSEKRGNRHWNENINTFQVTDTPQVPDYSDDVPDIMEKLEKELAKTKHPSKESVESSENTETTTGVPKLVADHPESPEESPELSTQSPEIIIGPSKAVKEVSKAQEDSPKTSTEHLERVTETATPEPTKTTAVPPKSSEEPPKVSEDSNTSTESPRLTDLPKTTPDFPLKSEELKDPSTLPKEDQCSNGSSDKNQLYSLSFPSTNSSAKPKHRTTLHSQNELTLCWIETVTTKEDNSTSPPKRLVLREYTITFENSVLIPDEYLWCPRAEGEVYPTTQEEAAGSPFQEYFASDTRKSKDTQFQIIDDEGNVTVIEEKTIRCGVGSFITKNIYERLDISGNSLIQVEVKVGPSLNTVTGAPVEETVSDEVSSISVDCLIAGTCNALKSVSTTTRPSETSPDTSETTPPTVDIDGDKTKMTLVPEELVCDRSMGTCGPTRSTSSATVTSAPPQSEDQPVLGDSTPSEEPKDLEVSTQTESTSPEEEILLGDNVTVPVAIRTTFPTTLWTEAQSVHKPRYALKLQVVLDRIDENDNRETLVNLKKEVALNHKNRTYMDLLDALNHTVSDLGVIRDLLKCSAFEGMSPIIWSYVDSAEEPNATRRSRSLPVTASQNVSEKQEILEQCLPDIRADISTGLKEIKSQLSRSGSGDVVGKTGDVVPTKTSNFGTERTDHRRSRRSAGAGDREAISQWSNERVREASDGGHIRSFTELVVLENSEVV